MIEVRVHGRGGQGNVVAAYLLATAAFEAGRHSQAFPSFGAERRGAPVTAFVRIADAPILRRSEVRTPSFLIVQDAGLLHVPGILAGLKPGGGVVINSQKPAAELGLGATRAVTLPASHMAAELLGKPMPNVALLAAFLALTGVVPVSALAAAVSHRFKGEMVERNLKLIEAATKAVTAGAWMETVDAASA
jgi:pyruvate ferredoxin oxidoreductase gamma subunit